jgi:aromatase
MGHTDNSVVIDAPIAFVWSRTNDLRSWTDLFTEYASVEILSEEPRRIRFRLTTCPDENGNTWSWVSERQLDQETWTVSARRIETGPFDYMNLRWTYEALAPGRTSMRWVQDFQMRTDSPVDDATMEERLNRGSREQMSIIAQRLREARSAVQSFSGTRSVRARGGDMRTMLSPATVGCSAGISGVVELQSGERVNEHYHPYSEEHLIVMQGVVRVDVNGVGQQLGRLDAVHIPCNARHRVTNVANVPALVVFSLSPLAPKPELGHVDTEASAEAHYAEAGR